MKVLPAPHFKVLLHLWYAIYGRWHRGVGLVTWAEIMRATGVSRYVVAESLSWFAQVGLVGRRSNHLRDVNQFTLNFNPDVAEVTSLLAKLVETSRKNRATRLNKSVQQTRNSPPTRLGQSDQQTPNKKFPKESWKDGVPATLGAAADATACQFSSEQEEFFKKVKELTNERQI